MDVKIDSLVSFDSLRSDIDYVFSIVEKNGKVVLLKDNKPTYIILKYEAMQSFEINSVPVVNYTLHEAMKLVLFEAANHTMHASELADQIFDRKLYLQKNGEKAKNHQIRARCSHYPDMFEALKGNIIKLKANAI